MSSPRPIARVLVTGGAGFIGSALIRYLVRGEPVEVLNFDALTYAGNLESLGPVEGSPGYRFVHGDIADRPLVRRTFEAFRPQAVVHLAAESHVDRSIDGPQDFIDTNIVGTFCMLQESLAYWRGLDREGQTGFRFHHVSTDEVFGSLGPGERFTEASSYRPSSPYSASKAASDHLVRAWHHTFGLPVVTTNCSNNYGPYQFPEKLIPLMILNALEGKALPIYGDGSNVRDWLYVEDHAEALWQVLSAGRVGETYNIGGHAERTNLEVVRAICAVLDELRPESPHAPHAELMTFVDDRPGHDQRYAIDAAKLERELGWRPAASFESGLRKTVEWYLTEQAWWRRVQDGSYQRERLGLGEQR